MSDDYLWDGSGKPDPVVQRLERQLEELRHNRPAPEWPADLRQVFRNPLRRHWAWLAAAAAIVLVLFSAWFTTQHRRPAWGVVRLEGSPKVGTDRIRETATLGIGQWLETDGSSRARIAVGTIGEVEVEPNTRIRLVRARTTEHRLALERGTIHARIWAPPRLFFVDTPSAVAVDLGCAYTLHVDNSGAGLLRVTMGWVGFELKGHESFIPAGALCATRAHTGPGTPYFEDASQPLRSALAELDFEPLGLEQRAAALDVLLAESRKEDALTLWHLLSRVNDAERPRVYDRLAMWVPPPPGVTRESILRGDPHMLDLWWDALGLGDTAWWRMWKRPWPSQAK